MKEKKTCKKSKFVDRPGRKGEHTALLATMQLQLLKQLLWSKEHICIIHLVHYMSGIGTGCPGKRWSHQPWRCSKNM